MEETKIINKIEDVQVGDIAYYEGAEKGSIVVGVDPGDDNSRLKIETPEEFKPFSTFMRTSVWLKNSYFRYAIRPTQNKPLEKHLPAVQERLEHIFETQEGVRIIYGGFGWRIESFLDDKRLLGLLDPSQFPLKDITEEES